MLLVNRSRARGSERPVLETTGEATRIVPRRAHGRAGEVGRWRLDPRQSRDPVLALILERAAAGSVPGARSDPHVVCLAIEGGGMRGSVSAGMCVVLEAAGLVGSFDRIYGCSAGALNGAFTASGQATLGATTYMDSADRRFIDLRRLIRGVRWWTSTCSSTSYSRLGGRSLRQGWRAGRSSGRWPCRR